MIPKKWIAVFPGQGSQHTGMGKEIYENFKVAKTVFEEASDSAKLDLKKLCFEGSDSDLKLTANTQPALLVTSVAMWRALMTECDLKPATALGHSLGEYSALVAAEALSLADAIVTVRIRGQAMQDAVPVGTGAMYALLGLHDDQVVKACSDMQKKAASDGGLHHCVIEAANFNCPGQVVISGHEKALEYFKAHFVGSDYGSAKVKLIPLAVSAPFHSSLMKPAAERLKPQLEKIKWASEFRFPVIHNVDAAKNQEGHVCAARLYDQVTMPVLWTSSVRHAVVPITTLPGSDVSHGGPENSHFVEIGAGRVLSGLIKKIEPLSHSYHIDTIEHFKKTIEALSS